MWSCVVQADFEQARTDSDAAATGTVPVADSSAELRALLDAADHERISLAQQGIGLRVETSDELLESLPAIGERRVFHVTRRLLAEARESTPRGEGLVLRACATHGEQGSGWELSGSLEAAPDRPLFRMWLPAA